MRRNKGHMSLEGKPRHLNVVVEPARDRSTVNRASAIGM